MKQQTINENFSVVQATDVVAADMDGETVMMRIKSGMYYGLDDVGSRIWELIATPRQISQVIDILMEEYDVERSKCQANTLELMNQLYDEGLIKIA
ncbi:hypothetical protein UF75_2941 [Desulfosporosinus sp. I2]|uniref:lasso peptide biosynthesis PqqD family chaperone n=1 Tax=Desulfosporosinus sp. I2 TaxID=1617025 RepID=UPI0005ED6D04|nr:lasso peptide biosynthesis PqqD family chaperone [Desulfosporosinus sp. I2]KJR46647.1 hypothetical protein UF75_2941 [Desulfosporosinus sp. I2]